MILWLFGVLGAEPLGEGVAKDMAMTWTAKRTFRNGHVSVQFRRSHGLHQGETYPLQTARLYFCKEPTISPRFRQHDPLIRVAYGSR